AAPAHRAEDQRLDVAGERHRLAGWVAVVVITGAGEPRTDVGHHGAPGGRGQRKQCSARGHGEPSVNWICRSMSRVVTVKRATFDVELTMLPPVSRVNRSLSLWMSMAFLLARSTLTTTLTGV